MNKGFNSMGGFTDSRGEWRPENPVSFAPVFVWPPKLAQFLSWLGNYLFTWNLFYLGVVLLSYNYLQPPLEEMKAFRFSWILVILLRNMALVWVIYGGWHLYLYILKKRGTIGKYCPRWQSTNGSTFLWNNQVYDNVFWACASAVPIWTAFEVVSFWMYANGKLPYLDFKENPVWFVLLFLLIPFWRELHFYLIHRLIHWKPLYKRIHYLHHYNINPGPWSGLAMHPIEHLLYFSVVLIHWVVPSHPLHFLFNSQHTALTPAPSHTGFEGKLGKFLSFGSYFHYLHHRLFECNYGESTIPLDKWFGIFEDGSQTQTEKMEATSKYKEFAVKKIVDESPEVKSFYLESPDKSEIRPFLPGQHLTFRIPILKEGESKPKVVLRSYTISNNKEKKLYRISVKREKNGQASSFLHTSVNVGDKLEAKGPKGSFTIQKKQKGTLVFIAGGIGITPIISMLKSLKTNKKVFLLLSVKEENLLCFKNELNNIKTFLPKLEIQVFFSQKSVAKMNAIYSNWKFHHKRLDLDSIKTILGDVKIVNFYLCGPEKMTQDLVNGIKKWKGKRANIFTESFGLQGKELNAGIQNQSFKIHFSKSGKTVLWDAEHSNILEFAESNGISMEAGCMFGECGACSTKINDGAVHYNYQTAVKPEKNNCLPCSSYPTSDLTLEA